MPVHVADYPLTAILKHYVQYNHLLYEYFTIFVWPREWHKYNLIKTVAAAPVFLNIMIFPEKPHS